ncbi:hypothetical protein VCRA219O19_40246 [Vibrio crassostreae]|nr:hypothetical protein VCRA219O19_40246 [Vibrio crassostreae]CAK2990331.1 hypothetical protein VCRA2113O23_40386 [Vibrio crassostreae]
MYTLLISQFYHVFAELCIERKLTLKYLSVVVAQWINTCWTWPLLSMEFAF